MDLDQSLDTPDTLTPDSLISRLSWWPLCILDTVISIREPIKSTILRRSLASSSIGPLDSLPTELLQIILDLLDFQSLSRFVQVCHKAKDVVELLPSYRRMMKHASRALIALSRTKLIRFHTAAAIHAALLSDKCVSCQKYAAYLFLPTCERCCYDCQYKSRSLRVITVGTAESCYGVSPKGHGRIPIMLGIPGLCSVGHGVSRQTRLRLEQSLVSLAHARRWRLSIRGSRQAKESVGAYRLRRQLPVTSWIMGSESYHPPIDGSCGMASIKFPSLLPNGELEKGFLCAGCQIDSKAYDLTERDTRQLESVGDSEVPHRTQYQARSRSEFLEHVKECKGAGDFLREPKKLLFMVSNARRAKRVNPR